MIREAQEAASAYRGARVLINDQRRKRPHRQYRGARVLVDDPSRNLHESFSKIREAQESSSIIKTTSKHVSTPWEAQYMLPH